jgi:hypothetical protein
MTWDEVIDKAKLSAPDGKIKIIDRARLKPNTRVLTYITYDRKPDHTIVAVRALMVTKANCRFSLIESRYINKNKPAKK